MELQNPHPDWDIVLSKVQKTIERIDDICNNNGNIPIFSKKILVIEDEIMDRNLVKYYLNKKGYETVLALDNLDAMEQILGGVDAVIVDWKVPVNWCNPVSVLELSRILKIPNCVYSGYNKPDSYNGIWITKGSIVELTKWLESVIL